MVRRLWQEKASMNKRFANQQEAKSKTLPQQSRFGVWTSGRLANVWDVKDIRVCVHIRNIPWIRGYFQNVKVPSPPYKRGMRARVKRLTTFEAWAVFRRFFVSSCIISVFERVRILFSCVRGSHPEFRIPPTMRRDILERGRKGFFLKLEDAWGDGMRMRFNSIHSLVKYHFLFTVWPLIERQNMQRSFRERKG
jgi:hypothetical protein